jgi:dienelactone hydrolase
MAPAAHRAFAGHGAFAGHRAFADGFYRRDGFDYEVRGLLGHAVHGASDVGEVLAAIADVGDGDHEAWFRAWSELGTALRARGDDSAAAGHPLSASQSYLRAAVYLGTAVNAVDGLKDESVLLPTFRAHRGAWDAFVDSSPISVTRVAIPYEGADLPGYLFRPGGDDIPRRTFVVVNGSDGSIASAWANAGVGALERGYAVLLFDGPGQQSELFERGTSFRFDWEAVLTPVVDFLLERPEVDPARLAVYGISQAGYWVPRALAFEHRIAAAVVDPGVVDVAASWHASIPKPLLKLADDGEDAKFDRDMAVGMSLSKDTARTWAFRARPYGADGYAATLAAVRKHSLGDVAAGITTPMLITSPEDEQFWPGQSQRLADLAPTVSTVVPFTATDGANFHCQPMARGLTDQRVFDWLDERLA